MVITRTNSVSPPWYAQFQKRESFIRSNGFNIEPVELDLLYEPIADFGNHLREIFDGTNYGISRTVDYTKKPEILRKDGFFVSASFGIYELLHDKDGRLKLREPSAGLIQIVSNGNPVIEITDTYSPNVISKFEERIRNYNLQRIKDSSFIPHSPQIYSS